MGAFSVGSVEESFGESHSGSRTVLGVRSAKGDRQPTQSGLAAMGFMQGISTAQGGPAVQNNAEQSKEKRDVNKEENSRIRGMDGSSPVVPVDELRE